MRKILVVLTTIFLAACGGGGGGAEAPAPVVPPAPAPLTITLNDSSHSTDEDNAVTANFDVSTNRSATLSYSTSDEPDYGSVSFSGNSFTYTPDDNFFGSDEFEVTASAESASDSAKISLTINSVNDVPVLEVSLAESDDSEYPLTQASGKVEINLTYSDVETAVDSLTLTATSDIGTVAISDISDGKANLDFSDLSGPKELTFLVTDGEASASSTLKLWYAKTVETEDNVDNIYTLLGNSDDLTRGFRWVVILDAMASEEILLAGRDAFKYFINDFVHNNNPELVKQVNSIFNMVVIESPIGDSTLGIVTGSMDNDFENCPREGSDPDIYCIADLEPIIKDYANSFFGADYFDNYSVVTGIPGRGVNRGNVNIQTLATAANCNEGCQQYTQGPNGLLATLKHEFGHGYLKAGDGYISDFIATDDNGDPLYDLSGRYKWQENYIDTSYVQDALKTQWSHQYSSTTSIPGRDDQTDTSTSAIGYWQGCYSHDTYCYRASYDSMMNGYNTSSSDFYDWHINRILSDSYNYDRVAMEGFLIRSFIEQGMHDIEANLSSDNQQLTVSTDFLFDSDDYELRWYLSHYSSERTYEEISGTRNQSSVTVERDPNDNYTTVAYRIIPLNSDSILKATDDIETFGDVYNGVFGPGGSYYCPLLEDTWEEVEERICNSTSYAVARWGTVYSSPIAFSNQGMVEIGWFKYWYEYSGLGAQFNINWSEY